LYYK